MINTASCQDMHVAYFRFWILAWSTAFPFPCNVSTQHYTILNVVFTTAGLVTLAVPLTPYWFSARTPRSESETMLVRFCFGRCESSCDCDWNAKCSFGIREDLEPNPIQHCGFVLSRYNSILLTVLVGTFEASLDDFVDRVKWYNKLTRWIEVFGGTTGNTVKIKLKIQLSANTHSLL